MKVGRGSSVKMLSLIALFLQFMIISNAENLENQENLSIYPVIMPMVVPARNEVYLCTSVDLSQTNETFWIRGFEPRVSDNVHHMALAGSNTKVTRVYQGKANMSKMSTRVLLTVVSSVKLQAQICLV